MSAHALPDQQPLPASRFLRLADQELSRSGRSGVVCADLCCTAVVGEVMALLGAQFPQCGPTAVNHQRIWLLVRGQMADLVAVAEGVRHCAAQASNHQEPCGDVAVSVALGNGHESGGELLQRAQNALAPGVEQHERQAS